jgi:hypothetical protein
MDVKNEDLFSIITLEKFDYLKSLFDKVITKDIHCSPDYIKLFQNLDYGEGFYTLFRDGENFILTPFFRRKINPENDYYDIISPWYYGGPLHNITKSEKIPNIMQNYINALNEYFQKNNIISEFQRLNPITENHTLYVNIDDKNISLDRQIVYIDLNKSEEIIWSEYNRHTRKNIRKAKREGLSILKSDNLSKDIHKFIEIYKTTMSYKKANKFYFFNDKFYHDLVEWFKDEVSIFFVEYKGELITTSLELGKYGVLHDYLRGTIPKFNILRPTELILDEIVKWAKTQDYDKFVLGGGRTNQNDDELLRFKKKMSSTNKDYYLYKKIHDLKVYQTLCQQKGIKGKLQFESSSFFPEYRAEINDG